MSLSSLRIRRSRVLDIVKMCSGAACCLLLLLLLLL